MDWKRSFAEGNEVVIVTASKEGIPHANMVISLGFVDHKLLVADCFMHTTLINLQSNNHICVVGGYMRIMGTVEIFSSGPHFEMCVEKSHGYKVNHAILITIDDVFDLDKVKKIM